MIGVHLTLEAGADEVKATKKQGLTISNIAASRNPGAHLLNNTFSNFCPRDWHLEQSLGHNSSRIVRNRDTFSHSDKEY